MDKNRGKSIQAAYLFTVGGARTFLAIKKQVLSDGLSGENICVFFFKVKLVGNLAEDPHTVLFLSINV